MKTALQKKISAILSLIVLVLIVITTSSVAIAQNIIVNGDFASGNLDNWTTYVADFDGVNTSFDVANGEATITNIVNAGNVVWHVQFNQFLTETQIGALVEGAYYAISFDARSSVDGRPVRLFFGEDGGDFRTVTSRNYNLTTETKTYTVTTVLASKFSAMKLGFEMGLSNADVIIDNVTISETDAVNSLDLPITFDDPEVDYLLEDFGDNASDIIVDPTNAENKVVRSIKTGSAEVWAGTTVGQPTGFLNPIPFSPEATTLSVRVWSPLSDIPIRLKVEKAGDPTISVETEARTTVANEWETLVFNFSNQASGTAAINFDNIYNKASIFFNFGTSGAESGEQTYYWDDVIFGGESNASAPPVPVGFVASNKIGEAPVGDGQVFLAAGPNNVEQANIVYRLFYALESANLQDPKSGTEYVFGNTAGDGEGNAAFGFVLGGLEVGVNYTFWLYQYDTEAELFSNTAAKVTTETGGGTGAVAPPVPAGFVAFNTIGETPVGNGEVFLAAGPNSVEQANIVYRLFYALTSANLENPKNGTQYTFGTTDGDGGGNAAFGFVLGGLEPGTQYSFWLYQYNTAADLYSSGAGEASVVSGSMSTNIGDDSVGIPIEYALSQNYPNPFNPTTSIRFALPESGQVQLDIYNMLGQRVMTVVNGPMSLGYHTVTFDASSLSSGLFLYRLQAGNVVLSKKMTLLK